MVAAAGALAPAGAYGVNAGMARAPLCRARAIAGFAKAPAAATIAAAATWPEFSDGNLGPDSTDDNLGPDSTDGNLGPPGCFFQPLLLLVLVPCRDKIYSQNVSWRCLMFFVVKQK